MASKMEIAAVIISAVSLCTAGVSAVIAVKNTARSENAMAISGDVPAAQDDTSGEGTVQYVMYVGTNDKDTYKPEYTKDEAFQIVDEICLNYFEGYTLQEATGSWKDEKDNITHEYTIVCYFDGAEKETVYHAADDIIAALNQNTVLIEENHISMDYYSSPDADAVSDTGT